MYNYYLVLYYSLTRVKIVHRIILVLFLIASFLTGWSQEYKKYLDSAAYFETKKDTSQSFYYFSRAKKIVERDPSFREAFIEVNKRTGDLYFSMSLYLQAAPYYVEARHTFEKLFGKAAGYVGKTDSLGILYIFAGDYTNAEAYLLESIALKEKIFSKESAQYAYGCNSLGNLYTDLGKYPLAEFYLVQAKDIRKKIFSEESAAYAQSCNNLAAFYWSTGDYKKAEPLAIEARQIRGRLSGKATAEYAISCVNLGNIYRDIGQYEKAETFYLEAKDVREKLFTSHHAIYASACNILADLYAYMERYSDAEKLYLEAKNIREQLFGKESIQYAQTCNNLSGLYRGMHQYKEAEAFALEAKDIWDRGLPADHPSHAVCLNNLGELYYAMHDFPKAEMYFLEARSLWFQSIGRNHPNYFQNAANLAKVYWNLNQRKKADSLFSESFNAEINEVKKIFEFTNENEKQLYLSNAIAGSDEFKSFYYKEYSGKSAALPYAISLSNRNLLLNSSLQLRETINDSGNRNLINKYKAWSDLKEQIAALRSKGDGRPSVQLKDLSASADFLEKELALKSSAFKEQQSTPGWKNVYRSLKENEAAIEFIQFQLYNGQNWTDSIMYAALIITHKNQQPVFVPLFEEKNLDKIIDGQKDEVGINSIYSNNQLYSIIWKPLKTYLKNITKIYYAPAGKLFKIAFAALQENPQELLSDHYDLFQLNTTSGIVKQAKTFIDSNDKIQLYGGIQYDADSTELKDAVQTNYNRRDVNPAVPLNPSRGGSFKYLPGTKKEVEEIKKEAITFHLQTSVLTGVHATEESFKSLGGVSSPSIIHIATHGFFFSNPREIKKDSVRSAFETSGKAFRQSDDPLFRSGLLFAGANNVWRNKPVEGIEDGILTAYEVSNLYLPKTKLVVLSACETALGDIRGSEGVYGLQRSFKVAGVQYLLMSLWRVPDGETSEFMQHFYKSLFDNKKKDIPGAFALAQNFMKNKYRSEPYKWAAWILIK